MDGRIQPYRRPLKGRLGRYVAVDVRYTPLVGVIATGKPLPLQDGTYDVVICPQVLEYVEEPRKLIEEIHRVIKV